MGTTYPNEARLHRNPLNPKVVEHHVEPVPMTFRFEEMLFIKSWQCAKGPYKVLHAVL